MRTPAGQECPFFYGDYFRGREKEECRLLAAASPPLPWKPALCTTCPVPGIARANACEFMILKPKLTRRFPFTQQQVSIRVFCQKTHRQDFDPHTGCGECHTLPSIFQENR
ncbi:MAG: hypothetical protein MUC85_02275 [Anaerolineales bacterium]|jgi:hypothetical protein|nr:hypothetical protein [Anaerolineales bacterium]